MYRTHARFHCPLLLLLLLAAPRAGDTGGSGSSPERSRGQTPPARLALRGDDRRARAREYADRQLPRDAGEVVGAMLQDARQQPSSSRDASPGRSTPVAGGGLADTERPSDDSAGAPQAESMGDQDQESEWPTDSSAPQGIPAPAGAAAVEDMPAGTSSTAAAPSPSTVRARAQDAAMGGTCDDAWLEEDGHDETLRQLVRLDRALAAHRRDGDSVGSDAPRDAWTLALYRAANHYDTEAIEELVLQAQSARGLAPGAPVWVQLPGTEGKEVDALAMTTGQLIEQVLTGGHPLPRGQDGRVLVSSARGEAGGDGSLNMLLMDELRLYEPIRSLLSHRLRDGFDVYSSDSSGPALEASAEEASGEGMMEEDWDVEAELREERERVMHDDAGSGPEVQPGGGWDDAEEARAEARDLDVGHAKRRGRGRGRRPHIDDFINLELGPYRDRVERFISADDWGKEDAEGFAEWWEWYENQTIAEAPAGVPRLNARLWRAASDERTCQEAQELVQLGAQVNSCDEADGKTALHKAITCADLPGAQLLLSLGADVEARDADGRTPLLAAAGCALMELSAALLNAGADLLAVDEHGWSVLHWAARSGCHDRRLVQVLIRHASAHALQLPWGLVNRDGFTAAEEARRSGFDDMAEYLLALARGESGENTWVGHGLDGPFMTAPLLQGSTCFVDSSDSMYDPDAPDAEHYRRITKQAKALGGPFRSGAYDPLLAEQKMRERDARRGGVGEGGRESRGRTSVESREQEWAAELDAQDCMYRTYSGWKGWREEGRGDYFDSSVRRHEEVLSEMVVRYPECFLTEAALDKYKPALDLESQRLAEHERAAARQQVPRSEIVRRFDELVREGMRSTHEASEEVQEVAEEED